MYKAYTGPVPASWNSDQLNGLHSRHPDSRHRARFLPLPRSNFRSSPRIWANGGRFSPRGRLCRPDSGHAERSCLVPTASPPENSPEITITGNFQSQDFETLIPATSHTPEKMVNWDALRADVQLSPSVVRGARWYPEPQSGFAEIRFPPSTVPTGNSAPASLFSAHLDTENADLAGILLHLAGYAYPMTGTMDLHLPEWQENAVLALKEPRTDSRS